MNERHIDLREIIDATLQEIAASVMLFGLIGCLHAEKPIKPILLQIESYLCPHGYLG